MAARQPPGRTNGGATRARPKQARGAGGLRNPNRLKPDPEAEDENWQQTAAGGRLNIVDNVNRYNECVRPSAAFAYFANRSA